MDFKPRWNCEAEDDPNDATRVLRLAILKNDRNTVRNVLRHRPGQQALNNALIVAACRANEPMMRLLLDAGADKNHRSPWELDEPSILHIVARHANPAPLRLLLSTGGVDLDVIDTKPQTPLSEAVLGQLRTSAKLLVDAGADVYARDYNRSTPFERAALVDDPALTALLLPPMVARGPDEFGRFLRDVIARDACQVLRATFELGERMELPVRGRDAQGRGEMHIAATCRSYFILSDLLEETDAVEAMATPDADGWNVLHWACRQEEPHVLSMLRRRCDEEDNGEEAWRRLCGARTTVEGWLPADVAVKLRHRDVLPELAMTAEGWEGEQGKQAGQLFFTWEDKVECDDCFCVSSRRKLSIFTSSGTYMRSFYRSPERLTGC